MSVFVCVGLWPITWGEAMQQIKVGIIGFGTVGCGTFEVLTTNSEVIANRVGAEVVVKRIADLDLESDM